MAAKPAFEIIGEAARPDLETARLARLSFGCNRERSVPVEKIVGLQFIDILELVPQSYPERSASPIQGRQNVNHILDLGEGHIEPHI